MRAISPALRAVLAIVAEDMVADCNPDGEQGSRQTCEDPAVEEAQERGLVVVYDGCPCGDPHGRLTPLGKLALRLPIDMVGA